MKTLILVLTAWAGLGVTQTTIPSCASACVVSALNAVACPTGTAAAHSCACGPSSAAFASVGTPCVIAACDYADQLSAALIGQNICLTWSLSGILASLSTAPANSFDLNSYLSGYAASTAAGGNGGDAVYTVPGVTTITVSGGVGAVATGGGKGTTFVKATSTGVNGAVITEGASSPTTVKGGGGKKGLSAGAKAGIGIGAALGGILFLACIGLAFWWGRRSKNRPDTITNTVVVKENEDFGKVELAGDGKTPLAGGAGGAGGKVEEVKGFYAPSPVGISELSEDEKRELEGRRRARELAGVGRVQVVELGENMERVELEALRKEARVVHELS